MVQSGSRATISSFCCHFIFDFNIKPTDFVKNLPALYSDIHTSYTEHIELVIVMSQLLVPHLDSTAEWVAPLLTST